MRTNGQPRRLWAWAIAATVLMTGLVGCGTNVPGPDPSDTQTGSADRSTTKDSSREERPKTPKDDNGDDVPTNIPQPIPNPEPPADPKALSVRAIANTVNSNPLAVFNTKAPSRVSVYVTLVWSKAQGAAQYRVSRNDDGGEKFYIRANVPGSFRGFQDGGVMNLKIDHDYSYLVEALDSSGRVVAKGTDKTKALYPLEIPKASEPENNADSTGIAPDFGWSEVKGAQGYYVEVFSGVYLLPMWRGFRKDELGTKIKYGEQVDMMPGTSPAIWTTVLNPAGAYTWSVTAVKTDTGNAATAKAWAKSNSPAWRFFCGKKPTTQQGGN